MQTEQLIRMKIKHRNYKKEEVCCTLCGAELTVDEETTTVSWMGKVIGYICEKCNLSTT